MIFLFYLNLFINYHFILIIKYFIASLNLFFHLIQQNFVFLLIYDINHYLLDYIQSYIHLNSWYNFIHNFLQVKLNEVQILNILYTCQVIQVLSLCCCISFFTVLLSFVLSFFNYALRFARSLLHDFVMYVCIYLIIYLFSYLCIW